MRKDESASPCLVIIQCDSGHINGDLIACARYRIYDMRVKALHNKSKCHVVFIVHLPVHISQSTFVGFQGDPWISCHIDQLRPSGENDITLEVAQRMSVSEIFYGGLEDVQFNRQTSELSSNIEVSGPTPLALERNIFSDKPGQCVRLNSCIQAAASGLQTSAQNNQRAAERVKLLIQLIPSQPIFPLGMYIHS